MKIIKVLFIFALVSMIAVSCKETKKEEVQDDAVEVTDEVTDSEEMEATDDATEESTSTESAAPAAAAGAAAPASSTGSDESTGAAEASSEEAAEAVSSSSSDIEEYVVPAGVMAEELAETPVVYPGCKGSVEEIRACNRKSFIAFLRKEFNTDLAKSLGLNEGANEIKSICQVDTQGKLTALKVQASHKLLEEEMKRVIDMVPTVVPATKGGKPVPVSFLLPINFKVRS